MRMPDRAEAGPKPRVERRLAAILAADVVGYSRLMGRDEEGTYGRFREHRLELIDPTIAAHDGRIVKLMGDGFLVEFASAVNAVDCAVAIQRGMAVRNAGIAADGQIRLRIGINLGDILVAEDDIFGDGVNVAARLEALAEPGAICVSAEVYRQLQLDHPVEDLGERQLKNIQRAVHVYQLSGWPIRHRRPAGNDQLAGIALPPPRPTDRPSVAVLAFDNLSGDPEQDYFSDGIAEDIITDLSKISGLFVIARNSAFVYRGRAVRVQDVSRDLGARFIVEGSVRKAGNRVRITTQLIDGDTGGHVWAERYDRELTDIFAVQDEVTQRIVAALQVKLTGDERRRTGGRGTDRVEAYELFLRGRELIQRRTRDDIVRSRPLFDQAIGLDPSFAGPHAGLAFGHVMEYVNHWSELPARSLALADRLARQALALDPTDPQSHYAMAMVHLWTGNHDDAIREAGTATELDPNSSPGYSLLGLALHYVGRSQEALGALERAMQLDPFYPDVYLHFVAQCHFSLRRYADAEAALKRRLVRNLDTDVSRVLLAACYGHLGQPEHAQAEWQEALRINPSYSLEHRRRVLPYQDPAEFEHVVEGLRKAGIAV
jgi:TolB-like protein/Tfp pilus assembly protein PilF